MSSSWKIELKCIKKSEVNKQGDSQVPSHWPDVRSAQSQLLRVTQASRAEMSSGAKVGYLTEIGLLLVCMNIKAWDRLGTPRLNKCESPKKEPHLRENRAKCVSLGMSPDQRSHTHTKKLSSIANLLPSFITQWKFETHRIKSKWRPDCSFTKGHLSAFLIDK